MVHIILVHGGCHGAWCWYKVKPLLEAAGHRVTALDMAASGIDPRSIEELHSLDDYTQPLTAFMASVPAEEKVVLVGHSFGGMNISVAMEMYPHKIKLAVFLAAFMPADFTHPPSFVLQKYFDVVLADALQLNLCNNVKYIESIPKEEWLDTETHENLTSVRVGPNCISLTTKFYRLCPPEDVALAKMLVRPSSMFLEDGSKRSPFTKEGFGSVRRAYIVCKEDKVMAVNFQRWQIESFGVDQVMEIENADHMPMFSWPHQLCQCLLNLAND